MCISINHQEGNRALCIHRLTGAAGGSESCKWVCNFKRWLLWLRSTSLGRDKNAFAQAAHLSWDLRGKSRGSKTQNSRQGWGTLKNWATNKTLNQHSPTQMAHTHRHIHTTHIHTHMYIHTVIHIGICIHTTTATHHNILCILSFSLSFLFLFSLLPPCTHVCTFLTSQKAYTELWEWSNKLL